MVPKKKKLLATGQAGFVSLESSTPERPVGTFVPSLGTPRRSPRLAAKRKRSRTHAESLPQPSVDRSAPVRSGLPPAMLEAVRTIAASRRCVELLDEVNSYVEYKYHDKQLDTSIVKAETSPNEIRRYVVVSRRLKAFDEAVGPHDSLRMVVGEDGGFRLLSYDKSLEEGVLTLPIVPTGDFHKAIEKLASERWVVCPGVKGYSTYKNSIGYDLKRVATSSWPPDTARDCECPVLYEKSSTKKSTLCSKCTSLKWRLAGRKREHEQYTSEHRLRSQASSTVPFDILSPESKKARLTNMRCEISTLRAKTRSNARMIDRIAVSDEQNDELFELIQSIKKSEDGQRELQSIFQEADSAGAGKGDILKSIWEQDVSDMTQFYKDQEQNVTGRSSNRWSAITIRLALAIFSRSPAAYHAVRSMGIMQLPCDKTLRGYMYKHASSPGINEEHLLESARRFETFKAQHVRDGMLPPVGEGVLIFDEVKVQSRVVWNSANSAVVGFAMSSDDFSSLHDVYEGLDLDEKCQKTTYVMQFLWRDLTSNFDVIGPYFTCPSTVETRYLHSIVTHTMLAFTQFGFPVRALLCDGASTNLSLLKLMCSHSNDIDTITPWFTSPFDGKRIFLIVCPSHQLKNMIAALYSSRDGATKHFRRKDVHFGWDTIVRVYNGDLFRAKQGVSRRVPGLRYSYIVRDSWTRLNVLPAKIMQQPYMLAAIKEMANYKDEVTRSCHLETAEYLEACNKLFKNGILSHDMIKSSTSPVLENMRQGFAYFEQWHHDLSQSDTVILMMTEVKLRSPLQKDFLAWQTWDLLQIMYRGFTGLCGHVLKNHSGYFISPLRINGSAIETIFSCLKYISGSNLSSTSYPTALAAFTTQREVARNPYSEPGYRS